MEFPKTTEEENQICYEEGLRIYGELKKKYPEQNTRDLDIILNSIICALVRMARLNTMTVDAKAFSELVKQIIFSNLSR